MKLTIKIHMIISVFIVILITGCGSNAGYMAGSLGSISLDIESTNLTLGESTNVTAYLSGAFKGTDPVGPARVVFAVVGLRDQESSNIATLTPDNCTITNPLESSIVSCSVSLSAAQVGSARVIVSASAQNTSGTTNPYVLESFNVISK